MRRPDPINLTSPLIANCKAFRIRSRNRWAWFSKTTESSWCTDSSPRRAPADLSQSKPLQLIAISASQCKPDSAAQNDNIFPVKHWMQFLDLLDVHHRRAADTQEPVRRELALQGGHRFPQHMGLITGEQLHVIVRGFH